MQEAEDQKKVWQKTYNIDPTLPILLLGIRQQEKAVLGYQMVQKAINTQLG